MLHYFQLLSALQKRIPRSSIISVLDYIPVSSPASPSALYSLSAHVPSSSSSFTMRLRNAYIIRLYIHHHHHHHKCYAFRQVYDTHSLHSSPPSALLSIYKRVFYMMMINDSVVVFREQVVLIRRLPSFAMVITSLNQSFSVFSVAVTVVLL